MRVFLIIILMSTIWGCIQSPTEEDQNSVENAGWFFWSVDWHPYKNQIVAGASNDTFFKLLSSDKLQLLKNYPYQGTITQTKWHPHKNKLAISVQDGKSNSIILNLDNEDIVELDSVSADGARALGWNPSGDLLAVGDYDGFINIFNEKGTFLKRIHTNQKGIIGLDWHPDENLIVAVGEKITLYHYALDSLKNLEDRSEEILMLSVAWHPNGEFFVTGDYGDFEYHYPPLLQYWTYQGERIKAIEKSKAEYRNLAWSKDGELLATTSEKIRLWTHDGSLVAEKNVPDLLWGLSWNKEGTKLASTDTKGRITIWDTDLTKLEEVKY